MECGFFGVTNEIEARRQSLGRTTLDQEPSAHLGLGEARTAFQLQALLPVLPVQVLEPF